MTFSIRIVNIDRCALPPSSLDLGHSSFSEQPLSTVPLIRIFGITELGQKACVYVHQVYPYFFIPYLAQDADTQKDVQQFGMRLNQAIDLADPYNKDPNSLIAAIVLVQGTEFYGFHQQPGLFLKIYLTNPERRQTVLDLLQSGALGQAFQPFEAHLSYELQFMIDHNLYGMDWLHLQHSYPHVPPNTHCEIEIDVQARDILNRSRVTQRTTQDTPEAYLPSLASNTPEGLARQIAPHNPPTAFEAVDALYASQIPHNTYSSPPADLDLDAMHSYLEEQSLIDTQWPVDDPDFEALFHTPDSEEDLLQPLDSRDLDQWIQETEKHEQAIDKDQRKKRPVVTIEYEEDPFQISQVPPDPMSRPFRFLKKFKIDQLDGAHGRREKIPQPSSKDLWDREIKSLRQMRKKKKATDEYIVSVEIKKSPIFGRKQAFRSRKHITPLPRLQTPPHRPDRTDPTEPTDATYPPARKASPQAVYSPNVIIETQELPEIADTNALQNSSELPKLQSQGSLAFLESLGDIWSSPESEPAVVSQETYFETPQTAKESSREFTEFVYPYPPPVLHPEDPILVSKRTVVYQEPFYSKPSDVPKYPTVFNGKEFRLKSNTPQLKTFHTLFSNRLNRSHWQKHSICHWTPAQAPPTVQEIRQWLQKNSKAPKISFGTQLDGPSLEKSFDYKYSPSKPVIKPKHNNDHVSFFSLELHVNTRDAFLPDPDQDPIQTIFYCLQSDDPKMISNGYQQDYHVGILALKDLDIKKAGLTTHRAHVDYGQSEMDLMMLLIDKIRLYNPDMLVGYEVQNASWGFLIERAAFLGLNLVDELSRIITVPSENISRDEWGYKKASAYKICGRHLLNVWRLMRNELALTSYTLENVVYHLLHHRIPHFSYATLSAWYTKGPMVLKHRLLKYYLKRVQLNLDLLEASQVISRTFESARIFGIDFFSVLTRGSQFKVESLMFRIGKPENFLMITPSRKQVAEQRSLECLPLVMEPVSKYYSSPIAVLDFQSLYPSIMIAHNYCYSTCLGRAYRPGESTRMGILESFEVPEELMKSFEGKKNISPNGVMFVKPEIRRGLLGKMLQELLDTRVKVKKLIKDHKDDSALLRTLDAKQLTLKFIANVTYGYTSASYSGRMPSVDIGDSIVSTGRAILEKTICLINTTPEWGAQVVYGDTDSVFVYFEGKSRKEAFALSQAIADTVTRLNPDPIKLKFEKIYHPSILLAKKRYVGFKYEHPDDTEPVYEAKGIETVRRDHTPATQKILESCLKIQFRTQDMSLLKEYLYKQWGKILSNRVSVKDFIIAKEVRMGTYSNRGGPNGAVVAQAKMKQDARAEPQYGERVPYVVVYKSPGAKLKDKVIRPEAILKDNTLRLDAEYYIRKQIIAPISRVFNLIGADIMAWYDSMPRSQKVAFLRLGENRSKTNVKKSKCIDQYYGSSHCVVCSKLTDRGLCETCTKEPYKAIYTLTSRQSLSQSKFRDLLTTCQDCSGVSPLDAMTVCKVDYADIPCDSLDCPIYYERLKAKKDVITTSEYDNLLTEL